MHVHGLRFVLQALTDLAAIALGYVYLQTDGWVPQFTYSTLQNLAEYATIGHNRLHLNRP